MRAVEQRRRIALTRRYLTAAVFLLPSFVFLGYFVYYPVATALATAFTEWDGFNAPTWVGLDNFKAVFSDPVMHLAARNTLIWSALGVMVRLVPAFVVAELIFHVRSLRLQYLYRTLFVIPWVIPTIVLVLLWTYFYQADGPINSLLGAVGLGALRQGWLYNPHIALYSLIFYNFPWIDGFGMLILYAGLQAIPAEVLEASDLDAASGLRRIVSIDLPLVLPQLRLLVVLAVIGVLQNIIVPLLMTNGGPGYSTYLPALQMYNQATQYSRYGYAMAVSVVLFAVILALTAANARVLRARD